MKRLVSASVLLLILLGCNRSTKPAPMSSHTPNQQTTEVAKNSYVETFDPVTFQVIDEQTRTPVVGAKVWTICTGGTPAGNSNDLTDADGKATVLYRSGNVFIVGISADGYPNTSWIGMRSDPVVPLNKSIAKAH